MIYTFNFLGFHSLLIVNIVSLHVINIQILQSYRSTYSTPVPYAIAIVLHLLTLNPITLFHLKQLYVNKEIERRK